MASSVSKFSLLVVAAFACLGLVPGIRGQSGQSQTNSQISDPESKFWKTANLTALEIPQEVLNGVSGVKIEEKRVEVEVKTEIVQP